MLDNKLTKEELQEISRFRFTTKTENGDLQFSAAELMNPKNLRPLLQKLKIRIEAPNHLVTASILMKRYAFLSVIYLYTLSKWNKQLIINPENVFFEDAEKNGMWLPEIRIEPLMVNDSPSNNRDLFREEACKALFKDHLFKLITVLNKETKVSKMVLWENICVYIFWMYEALLEEEPAIRNRVQSDFDYIFIEAEGSIFGAYKNNPLTSFHSKKVKMEETNKMIRIRKTCCYSYMLLKEEETAHCGTCPIKCKLREKAKKKGEEA